jgi:resuscitation-promoting factor RpfB
MGKLLVPAIAGGSALALVATVGIATAMHKNDVSLTVDGATSTIAVREKTVAEVLELEGIQLSEHDVVLPGLDTEVTDEMGITVLLARPFEVTVDGDTREVWTTGKTVQEALGFLDLDAADSKLSTSRSAAIGREGLSVEIVTAKDVTLVAGGEESAARVAGTVADVLAGAGIAPDSDDIVAPEPSTLLEDGMKIKFIDVEVTTPSVEKGIPYAKSTVKSAKRDKGSSEITTKGEDGLKRETYTNVYHDGQLQSSVLKSEEVLEEPVTQVTTVGTRETAPAASSSGTSSSGSSGGHAINLARAAMWDRIAQCESTGRWNINTGNGYYGGLQFNLATWRSVRGTDFAAYPHQATRAEQITVANRLYAIRGTQPWSCA